MLTVHDTAGTNPIHNKKPKKKPAGELDDEDMAFKQKQMAGTLSPPSRHDFSSRCACGSLVTTIRYKDVMLTVLQTRRPARRWPRRLAARAP